MWLNHQLNNAKQKKENMELLIGQESTWPTRYTYETKTTQGQLCPRRNRMTHFTKDERYEIGARIYRKKGEIAFQEKIKIR